MADVKFMSIKEFREEGYLQEVNRQFLHPLGLALEVMIDGETGEETIKRVWDARDDPEGWTFGEGTMDPEKSERIEWEQKVRSEVRKLRLGFNVQPRKQL